MLRRSFSVEIQASHDRLKSRPVIVVCPISVYVFRTLLFAASGTLGRAMSVTSRNRDDVDEADDRDDV
jgi:hypothetical protein